MHTQTYRYGNEAFCYVLLLAHKSINSALLLQQFHLSDTCWHCITCAQVVQVTWHKAPAPSQMDGSIVFTSFKSFTIAFRRRETASQPKNAIWWLDQYGSLPIKLPKLKHNSNKNKPAWNAHDKRQLIRNFSDLVGVILVHTLYTLLLRPNISSAID